MPYLFNLLVFYLLLLFFVFLTTVLRSKLKSFTEFRQVFLLLSVVLTELVNLHLFLQRDIVPQLYPWCLKALVPYSVPRACY